MSDLTITPEPTDEEAAAIAAAIVVAASPAPAADDQQEPPEPRWRFSGRWWSRPVSQRRQRPWRS